MQISRFELSRFDPLLGEHIKLQPAGVVVKRSDETIRSWIIKGILDGSGGRRTLAAIRQGGQWLVHPDELREFVSGAEAAK